MMLRQIAESDYHFDASVVGKWTMYQLKQYLCNKDALESVVTFGSLEEAREYNAEMRAKRTATTLREFQFAGDDEQ